MELQHTHTFRVTMTRSHRKDSAFAHASIKTNNTFDTSMAVSTDMNTERDACIQVKKTTSSQTYRTQNTYAERRLDDRKSSATKLMQNHH